MQAKPKAIANALLLAPARRSVPDGRHGGPPRDEGAAGVKWSVVLPGLLLPVMASGANHTVTANSNMTFTPSSLSIAAGDTVTFKNGGGLHNVASDPGAVTTFRCANGCDGAGGNGDPSSDAWSAVVTFRTAGTIGYFCEIHGAPGGIGMAGKITVSGAVVVARRCDFDADGHSDILWRNTSTGSNLIWRSGNSATQQAVSTAPTAWSVAGIGDFDADGKSDVLWRNGGSGANVIWRSANAATVQAVAAVNLAWLVAGVADFDGDGRADVLWRSNTGANVIWKSGSSATPQAVTAAATDWTVVAVHDYDGDQHADILWRRRNTTGANVIWKSASSATPQAVNTVSDLSWTVAR